MATEEKGIPMINSFLSLCRVCPVPTDDKVNSEYKRNFTWHDGYQAAKQEVIRNAPTIGLNQALEPSLPRKKRQPESSHRTHELIYDCEEGESSDSIDTTTGGFNIFDHKGGDYHATTDSKVRIFDGVDTKEEIGSSKRTDEKQPLMTQTPLHHNPGTLGTDEVVGKMTEYRSQFVAYPRTPSEAVTTARKSASMGFITQQALKKGGHAGAAGGDLVDGECVVVESISSKPGEEVDDDEAVLDAVKRGRIKKTEYKSKFRPFSAYTYVDGNWKKATKLIKDDYAADDLALPLEVDFSLPLEFNFGENSLPVDVDPNSWYSEVVERLKKADQYRVRSHTGVPLYGDVQQAIPSEFQGNERDRTILSPVSVAGSSSRTWKDERPSKDRPRPSQAAPVHHRKERREITDSPEHPKSREGSTKKKPQVEKTTVRPKSAEPVLPHSKEHKSSPKRTRPRAPRDLPVHGHGDLSGRKRTSRQDKSSSSPVGMKPRAVPRPGVAVSIVNGDDGKVWMKPDSSAKDSGKEDDEDHRTKGVDGGRDDVKINGYSEPHGGDMVNGEADDSVHPGHNEKDQGMPKLTQPPMMKPPIRVPLTTVKSPEEVTGVRSPDPESWTVPLEIGKGLHWMDGKTPDGVQPKTPPIFLTKRYKESSLVGKSQKDIVLCDSGSASTEDTVDL